MGKETKIEYCNASWNPITGCLHDCEYCYAKRIAERFGGQSETHTSCKCKPITDEHCLYELEKPARMYAKNGKLINAPYPCYFEPTFHKYRLNEVKDWAKPRVVFVGSMADTLGEWVPDEWLDEVFNACENAPQHQYLFLTKNPKRYTTSTGGYGVPTAENMWYGTTMTDSSNGKNFNYLPAFCNTFVSFEPLFEDIAESHNCVFRQVNWVIIGAETGKRKNKVVPKKEWIDAITAECDKWNVPVFMKDSLVPIIGEENMRRELPEKLKSVMKEN